MPDRLVYAGKLCPTGTHLTLVNAQHLPYRPSVFEMAIQFTVFSSIFDPQIHMDIAGEIERVVVPGGYLLWYDMCCAKSVNTRGIRISEVLELFPGFTALKVLKLHPVRASMIARRSMLLCDLWERIPGMKKTHILCLLQKNTG
jgi:hypothetical protein